MSKPVQLVKPMLAADALKGPIKFPKLGSPKYDGFRCQIHNGVALSKTHKPIRNDFVQAWARTAPNYKDGELIVGAPTGGAVISRTNSGVTSKEGRPNFTFYCFDDYRNPHKPYLERAKLLVPAERLVIVPQTLIHSMKELLEYEAQCLEEGYEGVMLRDPLSKYKEGRSTNREGWLLKLKRFTDGEGVVVQVLEGETNNNTAFRNEVGKLQRSTAKAGRTPNGMVGSIVLEDGMVLQPGKMSHKDRILYLQHPERLLGQTVHWRAFGYGTKDALRHPRYYGIREDV